MVYDRLAADKPLMVTRPVDPEALIDTHGYLSEAEWLTADQAPRIVDEAARLQGDPAAVAALEGWVRRYFGDTTPGAATTRFEAAIRLLMERWEHWHGERVDVDDETADAADAAELDDE